jgi:hypothetical protein
MPRGGKREGSGAKAKADKKKPITFYVEESKVTSVGGDKAAKELAYKAIDDKSKQQ